MAERRALIGGGGASAAGERHANRVGCEGRARHAWGETCGQVDRSKRFAIGALRFFMCALLTSVLVFSLGGCTVRGGGLGDDDGSGGESAASQAVPTTGIPAIPADDTPDDGSSGDSTPNGTPPPDSFPDALSSDALVVRYLDVGQGDSALVTCGGEALLIDGGPPHASSKVYSILRDLGVTTLDYVVVTHPDADHCGGVSGALSYARCEACFCSATSSDTKAFANFTERLARQEVQLVIPVAGDSFPLGSALVTFVGPTRVFPDENNGSLVLRIDKGDTSFLFAADAEHEAEEAMLSDGAQLEADVLKVAHHGSNSSSSREFLAAVGASCAVVSVGDNGYGHPGEQVLERLRNAGATVYRTDEDGTVVAVSDGTSLSVSAAKGRVNG